MVRVDRTSQEIDEPRGWPFEPLKLTLDEDVDPQVAAENLAQQERALRNMRWLESHWPDLLPAARGKYLAVACQEAHIADTIAAVVAWAKSVHPNDDGVHFQYVLPDDRPRIYALPG